MPEVCQGIRGNFSLFLATLVDCYFIFLVESVLYEKCILKRVLNLLIRIHLHFLSPFFNGLSLL
jgi:hypothetical protein